VPSFLCWQETEWLDPQIFVVDEKPGIRLTMGDNGVSAVSQLDRAVPA